MVSNRSVETVQERRPAQSRLLLSPGIDSYVVNRFRPEGVISYHALVYERTLMYVAQSKLHKFLQKRVVEGDILSHHMLPENSLYITGAFTAYSLLRRQAEREKRPLIRVTDDMINMYLDNTIEANYWGGAKRKLDIPSALHNTFDLKGLDPQLYNTVTLVTGNSDSSYLGAFEVASILNLASLFK